MGCASIQRQSGEATRSRISGGFIMVTVASLMVAWRACRDRPLGIGERLTMGYVIAPASWRRGYASEIAAAAAAHASDVLGAPAVHASVLSTNEASRRVLEKAGLSVECEIDHGNHVEVIYVIEFYD